jgi:hypothetical protein
MASGGSSRPKRQRTDLQEIIASTGLPVAPQVREHATSKRSVADELHKYNNIMTPYGSLYAEFDLPKDDGSRLAVQYLNPFALLWHTASISHTAAGFYVKHLVGRECRMVFYSDGVTPGNVLRPDHGRSFEAVYWTFCEFPDWLRARVGVGWFLCTFVELKLLEDVPGGMATVAKAVVETFFAAGLDSFNFARTGMMFQLDGVNHHFKSNYCCWLADEKAIKEIVSCKGSSGYKPCVSCKNIVNRTTPADGDYLVHVSCPDPTKFDAQTHESLSYMAQDLANKKGAVPAAEFDFLEKAYGLVYNTNALLFDNRLREVVRFPEGICWDWMHCLVASGGVAQYECNQLLRALVQAGISLKQVDEFCKTIVSPKTRAKLKGTFFRDRVVDRDGAHLKAFASEMLTAIQALGIFMDVVVKQAGVMAAHAACFDRLREIVLILSRGDEACNFTSTLRGILKDHHEAFQSLHPECMKPKVHYLKHAVDNLERLKCNLNCFGPERKHKDAKTVANFCYNKVGKSMLTRLAYNFFNDVQDNDVFLEYKIGPAIQMPNWAQGALQALVHQNAVISMSISTRFGVVHVDDVVWLRDPIRLARAKLAVRVGDDPTSHRFFVLVEGFTRTAAGSWSSNTTGVSVLDVAFVYGICSHKIVGDRVFV